MNFLSAPLPFPVSSSTIYDTLYDLEQKGLVTSYWIGDDFINKRTKKMYRITDEGKEYYKLHVADYGRCFKEKQVNNRYTNKNAYKLNFDFSL